MHPQRIFAWTDRDEMLAFAREVSFGHLFSAASGTPRVAHVPLLVTADGAFRFHLSRANSLNPALTDGPALLSILGAHGYVSADWYGSDGQVPTWNYLAIEVTGRPRRLAREETAALLDHLSAEHEARLLPKRPWTSAKLNPGQFERMLNAIEGYEIVPDLLQGTRKLGQNKSAAERTAAASAAAAAGNEGLAAAMSDFPGPA